MRMCEIPEERKHEKVYTQNLILTDQCEIVTITLCLQGLRVYSFRFWMTDMEKNTLIWIDRAIRALPLVRFPFTKCYYPDKVLLSQTNSVMVREYCLEYTTVREVR